MLRQNECADPSARRCRGAAVWDKQYGVDVERRRLLEATREAVARGLAAGNLWHTATHAEHARPMLQVRARPGAGTCAFLHDTKFPGKLAASVQSYCTPRKSASSLLSIVTQLSCKGSVGCKWDQLEVEDVQRPEQIIVQTQPMSSAALCSCVSQMCTVTDAVATGTHPPVRSL